MSAYVSSVHWWSVRGGHPRRQGSCPGGPLFPYYCSGTLPCRGTFDPTYTHLLPCGGLPKRPTGVVLPSSSPAAAFLPVGPWVVSHWVSGAYRQQDISSKYITLEWYYQVNASACCRVESDFGGDRFTDASQRQTRHHVVARGI